MAIRCPASPRKTRRPSPLYTGWGLRSKSTMATPMGGEIAYCKQRHVFIVELRALQKKRPLLGKTRYCNETSREFGIENVNTITAGRE